MAQTIHAGLENIVDVSVIINNNLVATEIRGPNLARKIVKVLFYPLYAIVKVINDVKEIARYNRVERYNTYKEAWGKKKAEEH